MCACVRRLEWAFKQEHPQFKPHFEQEQSIYEGALDWLICILMDRPDLFSSVAEHLRTNEPFVSFRVLQALHHILKVLFDIYLYICYSLFFFMAFTLELIAVFVRIFEFLPRSYPRRGFPMISGRSVR